MKFSTREDIDAPLEATFDMLCDFDSLERQALRRGADVRRRDKLKGPCVGMMWDASFVMRGRQRKVSLETTDLDRPNMIGVQFASAGLHGTFQVDCIKLTKKRTRVEIVLKLAPQNLSARLLVQSLKLARNALNKKFKLRVGDYARQLEERYRASV